MEKQQEPNTKLIEKIKKKEKGKRTIDSLGDLKKPIRRLPVKEPSEQRHRMALFLRRSDPNPLLNKTLTRSKLTNNPERILE